LRPNGIFYFEDANREFAPHFRQPEIAAPEHTDFPFVQYVHDLLRKDPQELMKRFAEQRVFPEEVFHPDYSSIEGWRSLADSQIAIAGFSFCAAWTKEEIDSALRTAEFSRIQWNEDSGQHISGYAVK
ncbi:hypothetical protein CMO92_04910, partial [Candidatus Woesearchaeota archaeon]|nr:hypothetical protein [Candidatus Woesearchaeota archaeon]